MSHRNSSKSDTLQMVAALGGALLVYWIAQRGKARAASAGEGQALATAQQP